MNYMALAFRTLRTMFAVVAVCVVLLGVRPLRAQVDAGTILGSVRDGSGASVSGAAVELVNEGTGASLTFTTDSDGNYKFTPIRIGSYKVTVTAQGFQSETRIMITVNVEDAQRIHRFLRFHSGPDLANHRGNRRAADSGNAERRRGPSGRQQEH